MNTDLIIIKNILRSRLSQADTKLDGIQTDAVCLAMNDFARRKVHEQNAKEVQEMKLGFLKTIFSFNREKWIVYLRSRNRKKARKLGQYRANTENRKIYGIRAGQFSYTLMSTRDVDYQKRTHTFKKDVDAIKLHQLADFVCYPKNNTSPVTNKK